MKTKIIYISGNEIFDIADIRAAFEEVRTALNLDKNTVLFGVPVDQDDAGLSTVTNESVVEPETVTPIQMPDASETTTENDDVVEPVQKAEPVVEKKRTRSRKNTVKETNEPSETPENVQPATVDEEKIVPILSILSAKDDEVQNVVENEDIKQDEEPEIIEDVITEESVSIEDTEQDVTPETDDKNDEDESDVETNLEKLLSEMKPLDEDVLDTPVPTDTDDSNQEENIDATLEKLANEFVQTQDKIASNTKSTTRNKIGKLRNILPFKQSKHADQGLGDLFGWAGVAANDEEFSVPGFFTTASSKK